jgi:hypothetical protein
LPRGTHRPAAGEAIIVPAHEDADGRLRGLHDEYVWEVNAAIGEGREDLVRQLVDDYLDTAMRMMSELYGGTCERPDCAICTGRPPDVAPPRARRTAWWRRLLRR